MGKTKARGAIWRKRFLYVVIALVGLNAIAIALDIDPRKIDFGKFFTRASWQHPDRVIESLSIQPGDIVADIGAGDGYFIFALADAVGSSGRVYAVDVDETTVRTLEKKVDEKGYSNIVVVFGEYDDPLLPDDQIDMVFLCNTYHHIEDRTAYFDRLRTDLKEDGRVAIIDLKGSPFIKFIGHDEHSTAKESLQNEMRDAHYHQEQVFDFLPIQNFLIFRSSR